MAYLQVTLGTLAFNFGFIKIPTDTRHPRGAQRSMRNKIIISEVKLLMIESEPLSSF